MTEGEITERITLLGGLMVQVHEDMAKMTKAMIILDSQGKDVRALVLALQERIANLEERMPRDRGIGRSP